MLEMRSAECMLERSTVNANVATCNPYGDVIFFIFLCHVEICNRARPM
jgi:hypothetical protein